MLDKQKRFFLTSLTALLFVVPMTGMSQVVSAETEIGTCEECVDAVETNVLSGALKAISFKASMLQLATSDGTSVVTYDDNTIVAGADDLSSIKTGSNLKIEYLKQDGVLLAVGIEVLVERPVVLASNEIDAKTLADLLSDNTTAVALIDARSASSFDKEHIPGALSMYTGEFDKNIDKLPANKNQLIVYYCDGTI